MSNPVLFIGCSNPTGTSGIQADIKSCQALGGCAMAVPTALSVQNSHGVTSLELLPPSLIKAQIKAVLEDIRPSAIKIGLLGAVTVAKAVVEAITPLEGKVPLIADPELWSSSGLRHDALEATEHLLPQCLLVTLSLPEATSLLAEPAMPVANLVDALKKRINGAFLLRNTPDNSSKQISWLWNGKRLTSLSVQHAAPLQQHGLDGTLAAAITTELAKGRSLSMASVLAHQYLQSVIDKSRKLPLCPGKAPPLCH
ncbi:bifunctional hydroxymethylpyrimidine kinase/phosphomethylpyrimidine kinase [Gallaecimonas mangrovi]|uniref:bifunctional hydroxymethylpyrimidine kinase/phosphomethylpyrimidine kinase n=1 Tax=Gallaecimonas mangrovi TaxID=2291597 RepID=UPI00186744C4|nr:hydroxymethylpyrimidine/phosphomethylpyrimidine kinase [Gallaecimonas mangrovi]